MALTLKDGDHEFMQALNTSGPGKRIVEYMIATDTLIKSGSAGCGVEETALFRVNLCRALKENARACGLPSPLPKVVAVLNLAGQRMLVYTSNVNLILLLVYTNPETTPRIRRGLDAVLKSAEAKDSSLLLCLSQPWQAGVQNMFWELRTLTRDADSDVKIADGGIMFNHACLDARLACNSLDVDHMDPEIKEAERKEFEKIFVATNLDVVPVMAEVSTDTQNAKLQGMLSVLKTERKNLIDEIASLKKEHAAELERKMHEYSLDVAKVVDKKIGIKETDEKLIKEIKEQNDTLWEQVHALTLKNKEVTSSKAEQDLLFEKERSEMRRRAEIAEAKLKAERKKAEKVDNNAREAAIKIESANVRTIEEMEKRIQTLGIKKEKAVLELEHMREACREQERVIEIVQNEKQALMQSQERELVKLNAQWKSVYRLMGVRMKTTVCERDALIENLKKSCAERSEAVETLKVRDEEVRTLQKELKEMEKGVKEVPVEERVKTAVACVQTDILQETLELGELTTKLVKLQDEIKELKEKRDVVGGDVQNVATSVNAVVNQVFMNDVPKANMDMGYDEQCDSSTEALIAQTASSMRALADLARESAYHKHSAAEGWAKYNALSGGVGEGWTEGRYPQQVCQFSEPYQTMPHGNWVGQGYWPQGNGSSHNNSGWVGRGRKGRS